MKRFLILCFAAIGLLQSVYGQEVKKFEYAAGPTFGVGFAADRAYSFGASVLGGYHFNKYFAAGVGGDFMHYAGRLGMYSTDTNMPLYPACYNAFRPFVYCRYDILPDEEWCPYVGGRLGYAIVLDAGFQHKAGLYSALDLGVLHRTDDKGRRQSYGISIESQYLQYLLRRCVSGR